MLESACPHRLGIRREDRSRWERRIPLAPHHVAALAREHGIVCTVQPSSIRVLPDAAYVEAGAEVAENLERCPVVLGVKEIPPDQAAPNTTYVFFSHTIKGQSHNRPLLPGLARADLAAPFRNANLPPPLARATVVYHGALTDNYRALERFLQEQPSRPDQGDDLGATATDIDRPFRGFAPARRASSPSGCPPRR